MITVFYDGKCSLCAKEIAYYKKIAPAGVFEWQDIMQNAEGLENEGIPLADGLKLLHAKDDDGKLHIGVDAFILIWRQMPRWCVLAFIVSLPIIKQVAKGLYNLFAQWRFKRSSHCQLP